MRRGRAGAKQSGVPPTFTGGSVPFSCVAYTPTRNLLSRGVRALGRNAEACGVER